MYLCVYWTFWISQWISSGLLRYHCPTCTFPIEPAPLLTLTLHVNILIESPLSLVVVKFPQPIIYCIAFNPLSAWPVRSLVTRTIKTISNICQITNPQRFDFQLSISHTHTPLSIADHQAAKRGGWQFPAALLSVLLLAVLCRHRRTSLGAAESWCWPVFYKLTLLSGFLPNLALKTHPGSKSKAGDNGQISSGLNCFKSRSGASHMTDTSWMAFSFSTVYWMKWIC